MCVLAVAVDKLNVYAMPDGKIGSTWTQIAQEINREYYPPGGSEGAGPCVDTCTGNMKRILKDFPEDVASDGEAEEGTGHGAAILEDGEARAALKRIRAQYNARALKKKS